MEILQAANRRKILKLLLESHRSGKITTFAFTHLAQNLKGSVRDGASVERLPSELIASTARIRTDLDEFSLVEREVLIYHGYTLMKNRVGKHYPKHCPELLKAASGSKPESNKEWPPRFVALINPSGGHSRRAGKSRKRLQKFLNVSDSQWFRDVRRFPGSFGGILVAFTALGWKLSNILLSTNLPRIGVPPKDWLRDRIMDTIASIIPAYDLGLINLGFL